LKVVKRLSRFNKLVLSEGSGVFERVQHLERKNVGSKEVGASCYIVIPE